MNCGFRIADCGLETGLSGVSGVSLVRESAIRDPQSAIDWGYWLRWMGEVLQNEQSAAAGTAKLPPTAHLGH